MPTFIMVSNALNRTLFLALVLLTSLGWPKSDGVPPGFATATLVDHKNMIYTLPRPGVQTLEDCYVDTYADDLVRDVGLMNKLGVTTVMCWNGWDFGRSHSVFLETLAKHNMTVGITFKPDLDGVMRKNLEKLSKILEESKVPLEFVYLDYPLTFDNADDFFRWVTQVRGWMLQLDNLDAPLFVRFFPEVTNPKTVQVLLQQWDEGSFDAWVVEAYSSTTMVDWLVTRMEGNSKKLFFSYGADTWNMLNNTADFDNQSPQLTTLVDLIQLGQYDAPIGTPALTPTSSSPETPSPSSGPTTGPTASPSPVASTPTSAAPTTPTTAKRAQLTRDLERAFARHSARSTMAGNLTVITVVGNVTQHLLSGAIQGFSDAWFLGQDSNYFQGGTNDVCPDKNPFLHTSCGGTDSYISYGDKYYSAEHMGIFRQYETIYYFRCVEPTAASLMIQKRWNPSLATAIPTTCTLSISIPAFYVFYIWGGGLGMAILALLASCCRS